MFRRQSLLFGILVVLALTGSSGAPSATSAGTPSAEAFGISVSAPGIGSAGAGGVSAPPNSNGGGSLSFPGDGSIARAASVSSSATGTAGATTTTASASVQVSGLSFFNGEITVGSVTAKATATATTRSASGGTGGSSVNGLVVMGQAVSGAPGTSVAYGSWGSVSVLQQSGAPFGGRGMKGYQTRVTALVVHLNVEHGGAPAGTDIVVGFAEVAAEMPAVAKQVPTTPEEETRPKPKRPTQPEAGEESARERRGPPPVRDIPYGVFPKLTAGRYVFPVYGGASYGDSFGAPRASTGWHHGEDIFAPLGAPILAVADGIVYSVGWNDVGGLRLWLQDRAGNEFYYAHLSAFSPLAVDGASVRAGDVLGFMGNTGDAEHTPYHLHFEIHPASLLFKGYDGVVAPYPYLNAWQRLVDLSLTAVSGWAPPISDSSNAPRPGAILLQARDISSATGLDPASLRRAMRASTDVSADGSLATLAADGRETLRALVRSVGGP